jgi:ABC-2 type transport system ATP-binding protein
MISIKNLNKSYGYNAILKNINLNFEKGKVYGVIGENGSGKTTLFKCLTGIESYKGTIESDYKNLKNSIGFLETDPFFFNKMTGQEYLQLLCNAKNIKTSDFTKKNIFDLPLKQYAATYSTGMKKKLALTAILLQKNDCFILDEPYNGVDIQSNIIITEIINELKKLNKIVILSSHIFSTLKDTCDQIHLLKEGTFVSCVEKENYTKLEKEMKDFSIGNKLKNMDLE